MGKNKWLIISYFANIDAMAPSHHIDDRLPFFQANNIDLHLISSPCGAKNNKILHTRVPSIAPSGIRYEVRYFLRRKTKKRFWFKFWEFFLLFPVYPFYFLEKIFLRLDTTWSWFLSATAAAALVSAKERPSVIYSTGGPVSAHLAAMFVSYLTGIPYIAEFQDPLVHQYAAPGRLERHFIRNIEKAILKTADGVVFLTRKAMENAILRNGANNKSFFIYAGAAPRKGASAYKKKDCLTISHFGSLAGTRNLEHFFKGLEPLIRERPEAVNYLRLNLFGSCSRAVLKQMECFPYNKIVHVMGKVKRQDALKYMNESDILLLIQNTDDVSYETIPSKAYEYLHAGRPVLGLVYRNPELREMLAEGGHEAAEADDDKGIKKGIEIYIDLWNKDLLLNFDKPSGLTVQSAVEKLISMADNILKMREKNRL